MATIRLTEKTLASLPLPTDSDRAYYWDSEQRGFGVTVYDTGRKAFIVRGRVNGSLTGKLTIGVAGQPRDEDGHLWTVQLARLEARKKLGAMASGKVPEPKSRAGGPTLQKALDHHVSKMERGENRRGKECSPRSIATLRGGIELHLEKWLDRPIVEVTREVLRGVVERIESDAERVEGSNPANPPGRAAANRVLANFSAVWNSADDEHDLKLKNPTPQLAALKPRDNRIDNEALPGWYELVQGMENGVRRDLQLVALFTGMRTDGVRNLRWDDVDFDDELLQVTRAKGDRPYTLPMTKTVREALERRQRDNPTVMKDWGGDNGFVFPTLSRDGKDVIATAEVKERITVRGKDGKVKLDEEGEPIRETYLPGIQATRKTFNSVAIEIGVPREAREALMNHEGRGVNVKSYGFPQNWDYLRSCADQVEAALWARIKGELKKGRRGKLRAV